MVWRIPTSSIPWKTATVTSLASISLLFFTVATILTSSSVVAWMSAILAMLTSAFGALAVMLKFCELLLVLASANMVYAVNS